MQKFRLTVLLFLGISGIIVIVLFVIGSLRPKIAGIYIDTVPVSSVWLNGRPVGKTPYRGTTKPGETIIRLIPDEYGTTLIPYETKVNLLPGVETVIRRSFGSNNEDSAGDIISFEKNVNGETNLVAISIPDSSQLIVDGVQRAFTPHKTSSILPGEHELRFSIQGYNDRIVKVKITKGYKLTAIVQLSKNQEQIVEDPNIQPTSSPKVDLVEILSTDTGFLRVRREASSSSDEVGRVEPGKKYTLMETNAENGWYKIEYEEGKSGWISNRYARKLDADQDFVATNEAKLNTATSSAETQ